MLEIFPAAAAYSFLLAPVILSLVHPVLVAYFIIAFDLYWLIKAFRLSTFLVRGYARLRRDEKIDWSERLAWLEDPNPHLRAAERKLNTFMKHHPKAKRRWSMDINLSKQHQTYLKLVKQIDNLRDIESRSTAILKPSSIYNVVIMAAYNESKEVLESSIKGMLEVDYPMSQLMLILAYEERGPEETKQSVLELVEQYGHHFAYATAIMHPDGIAGEVRGKGGNITYAGRKLAEYIESRDIDPEHVIVTTFDSDHRASRQYFSYLSYCYSINSNRVRKSYQPVPMFYNNIWDAPAPMRVIATSNSFWLIIETMRPHRLRNFAAHAQSLRALLDTDFWSVTTIVEDGHQYWRSYFTYDGDHEVVPMYVPVFQDAVLADTYIQTFKVQYQQLRRWAWGVSDFSYVVRNAIRNKNIRRLEKIVQVWRQFEGHFSWATAVLTVTFVAWLPLFLNQGFSENILAHQLPQIASRLMNVATLGLIVTVAISMISLPPRPDRYGPRRSLGMLLQWGLLPITSIFFSSVAALDAQTRLMLGKSLDFQVTDKSRKS